MGEEIAKSEFSAADFARYQARLEEETALLTRWFDEARFADDAPVSGFELEAWLVDEQHLPAPLNERFLQIFDSELASPELARFNIEVNSTPRPLRGHVFSAQYAELQDTWRQCRNTAQRLDAEHSAASDKG